MGRITVSTNRERSYGAVSVVLFLSLFAAQAGAIALSPVLVEVARDLDVSTAAAGQLRTVAGLVAGITALALGRVGAWIGLRHQLLGGSLLLALGSLGSAAAGGMAQLVAAQLPVGAGIAILTTAGTLAAAEWVPSERRAAVLSWALIGQPAAWIVGMPLVGAIGERSWRYAWIVLPLPAAVLAGAAVVRRGDSRPAARESASLGAVLGAPGVARWLAAETFVNTAWAGTLVYAGALFVESYGSAGGTVGWILASGAGAYVAGNLALRRLASRDRSLLIALSLALAVSTALFGAVRPAPGVSAALFSAAAFLAGGRTFLSSAVGLAAAAEIRPGVMAMRAASMQFGYFAGSFAAGAALAWGGYPTFGLTTGVLCAAAAMTLGARLDRSLPLHRRERGGNDAVRRRVRAADPRAGSSVFHSSPSSSAG